MLNIITSIIERSRGFLRVHPHDLTLEGPDIMGIKSVIQLLPTKYRALVARKINNIHLHLSYANIFTVIKLKSLLVSIPN